MRQNYKQFLILFLTLFPFIGWAANKWCSFNHLITKGTSDYYFLIESGQANIENLDNANNLYTVDIKNPKVACYYDRPNRKSCQINDAELNDFFKVVFDAKNLKIGKSLIADAEEETLLGFNAYTVQLIDAQFDGNLNDLVLKLRLVNENSPVDIKTGTKNTFVLNFDYQVNR